MGSSHSASLLVARRVFCSSASGLLGGWDGRPAEIITVVGDRPVASPLRQTMARQNQGRPWRTPRQDVLPQPVVLPQEQGVPPSVATMKSDEPMPRVLALPESASVSARKVAKKAWPPVEPGCQCIIYCPAELADYLQAECTALMKVNEDGSLVCCEVGCITPHFGLSSQTRAPYNAALHLRTPHVVG